MISEGKENTRLKMYDLSRAVIHTMKDSMVEGMAAVDCEKCAGSCESDVKNLQGSRVGAEQLFEAHQSV